MRRSARLQAKQDANGDTPNSSNTSSSKPSTRSEPRAPDPTPFGSLYKLPPELRSMVWDHVVNSEQGDDVNFLAACQHDYTIAQLSKHIHAEVQPIIKASQSTGCKHTDFVIKLPDLGDMPDDEFETELLQSIQERASLGTQGHDVTQANILTFETGHLGDDTPKVVICYFERGEKYFSYDIVGGSGPRRDHVEEKLLEVMVDVKKALGDGGSVEDVDEQEDDDSDDDGSDSDGSEDDGSEDPGARTKRLQTEAMTYLAEGVRTAVCEATYVGEPRFLGSNRGNRHR